MLYGETTRRKAILCQARIQSKNKVMMMLPRARQQHVAHNLIQCPPETNPAEYFIDLVSIDTEDPDEAARDEARIEELAAAFARHMAEEEKLHGSESVWQPPRSKFIQINLTNGSFRPLRWIRRSMALLRRSWRQNIRNNKVNALRLVAAVGNSFLFSQIFATVKKGVPTAKSIADRVALLSFGVINMSMVSVVDDDAGDYIPYRC